MSRVEPETFEGRELARIFLTPRLREARETEELLTLRGVSYIVSAEPFGRTLFGSPRNYAVFYVLAEEADHCAQLLTAAGLEFGVVPRDARNSDGP